MAIKVTPKREGTKVTTGMVRASYANVFVPKAIEEGNEPKYSVNLLIPKTDKAAIKAVKEAIEEARKIGLEKNWSGKLPKKFHEPLRDGDVDKEDDEVYAGHYFINASSFNKPGIIDIHKNALESDDEFYSGCFCRATINFYPFSKAGNNGIGAGLNNLQKLQEGERLAGKASAESDFDDDFELDDEDDGL